MYKFKEILKKNVKEISSRKLKILDFKGNTTHKLTL